METQSKSWYGSKNVKNITVAKKNKTFDPKTGLQNDTPQFTQTGYLKIQWFIITFPAKDGNGVFSWFMIIFPIISLQ
jgi:hypothetical protein